MKRLLTRFSPIKRATDIANRVLATTEQVRKRVDQVHQLARDADVKLSNLAQSVRRVQKQQEELRSLSQRLQARLDGLERQSELSWLAELSRASLPPVLDWSLIDRSYVKAVYTFERARLRDELAAVLAVSDESASRDERAFPSEPQYITSGHVHTMLARYMFAGKLFGQGARVLDTCCGRGWGTRILSLYSSSLVAYDREPTVIEECKAGWPEPTIEWRVADALRSPADSGDFDLVTSMEVLEHFHQEDGREYLRGCLQALRPGGVFVGTSYFPATRKQADQHPTLKRPGHLFLWTDEELRAELNLSCDRVHIVDRWLVLAQKAGAA